MKNRPNFIIGDIVEYKAGKRGFNYNFNNGQQYKVLRIHPPVSDGSEWGGWTIEVEDSNKSFPASWFRRVG